MKRSSQRCALTAVALLFVVFGIGRAAAQTCYSEMELDEAARTSIRNTVRQYAATAQQNSAGLQASAEFSLADIVQNGKDVFAGLATLRSLYLLDNTEPSGERAEFFCGIYNSPDRVTFIFESLPRGKYAVALQDVSGKTPGTITWILHQTGTQWKIAGLYPRATLVAGHDANWYLAQARAWRSKGQTYNAWLYYLLANDMMRPFPAMSTRPLDRLYDEIQQAMPKDLPSREPITVMAGGRSYKVTDMFATPVGENLYVVVKYQEPDISDTAKTFQQNMSLIKATVARYPELRNAFAGVVARAVAPSGQDYGSLLAMKDLK